MLRLFTAMSAAVESSVSVARASAITDPIDDWIADGSKPARPSAVMASATSRAEYAVPAPISRAFAFSRSKSCSLACVTARTFRIWLSKSANAFTASASGAAAAPPSVTRLLPIAVAFALNAFSCAVAFSSPLRSLASCVVSSMYACPARTEDAFPCFRKVFIPRKPEMPGSA